MTESQDREFEQMGYSAAVARNASGSISGVKRVDFTESGISNEIERDGNKTILGKQRRLGMGNISEARENLGRTLRSRSR